MATDGRALLRGRSFVTGASAGLGTVIARRLAAEGSSVCITGRNAGALEELAAQIDADPMVCDLADRTALPRALAAAGDVDVLVCNAALPATGPIDDFTIDQIDRALDVNLRAPILLARAAAIGMARRGRGHIVFVSSMAAKTIAPALGLYGATKAGMRSLSLALREDLRPAGVGVSVILPGPIKDVGMWADAGLPTPRGAGRLLPPSAVADAVVDGIVRDRAEIEVASMAVRMAGVVAQLRPSWFAALGRRAGSAEVAAELTAADRRKR